MSWVNSSRNRYVDGWVDHSQNLSPLILLASWRSLDMMVTLGMNGTQVCVLEQRHEVGLCCFLKGKHSLALESDLLFEFSGNLSHQPLEGQLSDQQVGLNK